MVLPSAYVSLNRLVSGGFPLVFRAKQSKRALGESREGGFFLRKKPLEDMASGYSYSGFAIVAPETQ